MTNGKIGRLNIDGFEIDVIENDKVDSDKSILYIPENNEEIKTLKDLKEKVYTGDVIEGYEEWYWTVDCARLKAEVVKWIKNMEKEKLENKKRRKEIEGAIYFVKIFFNLPEKDLEDLK
jgi:hypothetical protein